MTKRQSKITQKDTLGYRHRGTVKRKLADEEWIFINPAKCGCEVSERSVLFRYELAREADQNKATFSTILLQIWSAEFELMKRVFGDHFPITPYLGIKKNLRYILWRDAFADGSTSGASFFDDSNWDNEALSAQYVREFNDTGDVGELVFKKQLPEEFMLMRRQIDYEVLLDEDVRAKVFNPHKVIARLEIDLNYPNKSIEKHFKRILSRIRQYEGKTVRATLESRGRTPINVGLRSLASLRLKLARGTFPRVEAFLGQKRYEIKLNKSKFSDDCKRAEEWLLARPMVNQESSGVRGSGARRKPR